jgi:carbon monoxide dehydrogenase subunit G
MKKLPLIVASLMLVLQAVPVGAADVSGVWSLRLTTSDGDSAARASVTLKQDGEKLTGSCVITNTDQEFTVVGQVTDTTLTWRCASTGPLEAFFKGTVDSTGRQMTGEWATAAPAKGTFKGSRSPK